MIKCPALGGYQSVATEACWLERISMAVKATGKCVLIQGCVSLPIWDQEMMPLYRQRKYFDHICFQFQAKKKMRREFKFTFLNRIERKKNMRC